MRYYLLFFGLFFSSQVFSVDYHWYISTGPGIGTQFTSPDAACRSIVMAYEFQFAEPTGSETTFNCVFLTDANPPARYVYGYASRVGTTCPADTTYNPDTGQCDPEPSDNPCEDKAGDSIPFSKQGNRGDGFYDTVNVGGKNMGVTPDQQCVNGCSVTLNSSCKFRLSTDEYSCSGYAYFTGSTCVSGPNSPDESPDVRDEAPEVVEDKEPCVYVQDAEGRLHCVSSDVVEHEGQNCGSAGPAGSEQPRCFPKEAKRDEQKTETEVEEKTEADGSKTTTKTDVHTETKCNGTKDNCTTTTTTTTTTTKTDGSGTTTKTTTTCKGANCGSGLGGGGGGGTGDGDGDDEYDAPGDLVGNDDVPGFGDSLGDFSSRIQGSPIVSAVQAISFPSGGSCNMPSANVYLIGNVSFDWFCQNANILDALYYVMLGVFALGAVRLFLEA